jgi:hypothetical protein
VGERWTLKTLRTLNTLQQQRAIYNFSKIRYRPLAFFCGFSVPLRLQRPMQIFPT